jgi:membrane-associated protease RseP (regulator of RpoE activity)
MKLRRIRAVVLALAVGAAPLLGASAPRKELVTLPAIKVYGSWIAVNYYQGADGCITRVVIAEVTPKSPAARQGLRKGDELIAIDDIDVTGMSAEQFVEAYSKDLLRNAHRDYDFRCFRGFLSSREQTVRFRITN